MQSITVLENKEKEIEIDGLIITQGRGQSRGDGPDAHLQEDASVTRQAR
jgi:hypothetical protein